MWLLSFLSLCRRNVEPEPQLEWTVDNCGLSKEQIQQGSFTFKALGWHRQSSLSLDDLVFLCFSVGMNPPEYVIEAKLRRLGLPPQTPYNFEHFLHLWRELLENQDEEEIILERAFNFFDRDGNGEISTTEFKTAMKELGNLLSDAEMDEFLELMDTNKDGAIDYGEFIRLLKCQRPVYVDLAQTTSDQEISAGSSDHEIPSFPGYERTYTLNAIEMGTPPSKEALPIQWREDMRHRPVEVDKRDEAVDVVDGLNLETSP